MTPVGFEPAIPISERPQTYALDRAANEIGSDVYIHVFFFYPMPHMSFTDFMVFPPGHGRSVTDFWGYVVPIMWVVI